MGTNKKTESNSRKSRETPATRELISIYGPFLALDPDRASPEDLLKNTVPGYFRACGLDDPTWFPKPTRLTFETLYDPSEESGPTMNDVRIKKILEIGQSPKTHPFLKETLRNSLLMIGIATDAIWIPKEDRKIEFKKWLSEVLECRRFNGATWTAPGTSNVKPEPYLPGYPQRTDDQKEFDGIFAIFRMGLVDAIINAFTTSPKHPRSNGSYHLGICRGCGLFFKKERSDNNYHPKKPGQKISICKQKYLSDKKNTERKNVHSPEARAKMSASAVARWEADKEKKLLRDAIKDTLAAERGEKSKAKKTGPRIRPLKLL
ncbi:MAG: hypothetical protein WA705_20310 [Candidatus Ozemobacteraceae bacterium]